MLHTSALGCAAHGDVPAGVDEARSGERETLGHALGREALADAAEVELVSVLQLDPPAGDDDAAPARGGRVAAGCVGSDLVERPVVPGRDERSMDGRVEDAARALSCRDRQLDDLGEIA